MTSTVHNTTTTPTQSPVGGDTRIAAGKTGQPKHAEIIACNECRLLVELVDLRDGTKACCPRCGYVLTQIRPHAKQNLVAFAITASLFLLMSLLFGFLSIESHGIARQITLLDSFHGLIDYGYPILATILFTSTLLVPALFLLGLLYTLLSCYLGKPLPLVKSVARALFALLHWNMSEIFLLSILISFIKIMALARVGLGMSFDAYLLFILAFMATLSYLDRYQLWRWVTQYEK